MRRLLTGGIKAILAIAALSTAAHWALRVQRDPAEPVAGKAPAAAMATIPDPVATGSIVPRKIERATLADTGSPGLDQQHLLKLISGAAERKPQKAIAKR